MSAGASENKDRPILRASLLAVGLLSTGLAVLGIFLPLLPTVPLLLLAAACFVRSSARLHRWLLDHPRLGPLVSGYLDGEGMPLRVKVSAILLIWISIPLSAWLVPLLWVSVLLILLGLAITIFYLLSLPTLEY
ncbi:MAG: YbaN family protein [Geoalkalibacter sp.]|uniref:YbaN family protein n=1 Tax=Geoalkalibacter sp. TaxID=3041440 RepID=UPI003D1010B8